MLADIDDDDDSFNFISRRSRDSYTYLNNNDEILGIIAQGYDELGGTYYPSASIVFLAETTHANLDTPGRIEFKATPDGDYELDTIQTIDATGVTIEQGKLEHADASGTFGLFGVTPASRATALTTQLGTLTYTAPSADYDIQDMVDVSLGAGWAFKDHDEANSVLAVISNLQTRVSELETKLQTYGLLQ
jgi:hypothetical protein